MPIDVLLPALVATTAAGLALLMVRRRTVPVPPRCGRCSYDVRGLEPVRRHLDPSPEPGGGDDGCIPCPECGLDLAGPDAIHFAERRPVRLAAAAPAVAFVVLLVGGLGHAWASRVAAIPAGGVPAATGTPGLAEGRAEAGAYAVAAGRLLARRLPADRRAALLAGLQAGRDAGRTDLDTAVSLVGAMPDPTIPESLREAAREILAARAVRVMPRVPAGESFTVELSLPDPYHQRVTEATATARRVDAAADRGPAVPLAVGHRRRGQPFLVLVAPDTPGRWSVELRPRVSALDPGIRGRQAPPADEGLVFTVSLEIEVLPGEEPWLLPLDDEASAASVRRAWSVTDLAVADGRTGPRAVVTLTRTAEACPPFVFDAWLDLPVAGDGPPIAIRMGRGQDDGGARRSPRPLRLAAPLPEVLATLSPDELLETRVAAATVRLEPRSAPFDEGFHAGAGLARTVRLPAPPLRIAGLALRRPTLDAVALPPDARPREAAGGPPREDAP